MSKSHSASVVIASLGALLSTPQVLESFSDKELEEISTLIGDSATLLTKELESRIKERETTIDSKEAQIKKLLKETLGIDLDTPCECPNCKAEREESTKDSEIKTEKEIALKASAIIAESLAGSISSGRMDGLAIHKNNVGKILEANPLEILKFGTPKDLLLAIYTGVAMTDNPEHQKLATNNIEILKTV